MQEIGELESEKKALASDFNSKIKIAKQQLNMLSRKRRDGYEMRRLRCRIEKNWDLKQKEYYSVESGELVKAEPFDADDYQTSAFNE